MSGKKGKTTKTKKKAPAAKSDAETPRGAASSAESSAGENPYSLDGRGVVGRPRPSYLRPKGAPRKYVERQYSAADRAKMLEGYREVPLKQVRALLPGAYIRYETTAGEFRKGGYISKIWKRRVRDVDRHGRERQTASGAPKMRDAWYLQLTPGKRPGRAPMVWTIALDTVGKVWVSRQGKGGQLSYEAVEQMLAETLAERQKADDHRLRQVVGQLNANIQTLADYSQALSGRLARVEERLEFAGIPE